MKFFNHLILLYPLYLLMQVKCGYLLLFLKKYKSKETLISFWESSGEEQLNLKCCRMILSFHRKSSRIAILGELGRHPVFSKSLSHCLNYKLFSPSPHLIALSAMPCPRCPWWLTQDRTVGWPESGKLSLYWGDLISTVIVNSQGEILTGSLMGNLSVVGWTNLMRSE